jgi:hypothetical protein
MAKKKEITNQDLIDCYIANYLEQHKKPSSIYKFAKDNHFEEAFFYQNFSSFDQIEHRFFANMFQNTLTLLGKSPDYENYDARTKLLSFYFTFFEMLTANRSFVVVLLDADKNKLKSLSKLSELRTHFKAYFDTLAIDKLDLKNEKLNNFQDKTISELAWLQFTITLKFWLNDTSLSFEKTDIFIEKSVNTSFDLMNTTPIKSLLDFGKFMWQEQAAFKL